jgi:HEAT repeat protein
MLIGPGSKQRYMDAKTVADKIMKVGTDPAERVKISDELTEILDKHTTDAEGDVRHFLLLALGRAWQVTTPGSTTMPADTPDEIAARQRALATLLRYANSDNVSNQKAAILAFAYWAGRAEVREAMPMLIAKLRDEGQDLDVRLAAATVLGPIASPTDRDVIEALKFAMRDTKPENIELVWGSALSLAQLNQKDVADTILMLLDRKELSQAKVLDRETDPKNPEFHLLSDKEQERILINTMIGAARLDVPKVRERMKELSEKDPSPRVRAAAQEVLGKSEAVKW